MKAGYYNRNLNTVKCIIINKKTIMLTYIKYTDIHIKSRNNSIRN